MADNKTDASRAYGRILNGAVAFSQELKEMLPALVLTITIMAQFWRPLKKQGKAEWIKYWYRYAVLYRMNTHK